MEKLFQKIQPKIHTGIQQETKVHQLKEYTREEILSIFKKISKQINAIYGRQKKTFLKMLQNDDRNSFILEVNGKKVGLLVFKKALQSEDISIKSKNGYIELKSFFLFDEFGKGNIWHLWKYFLGEIEKSFGNRADGIYVTISKEKAHSSYEMFRKLGFEELYSVKDEYFQGNNEAHLFYKLK